VILARWYQDFIVWIGNGTGLPDTVLHIHAGLAVLMLARVATGRSLGTFVPLSVVAVAELGNEVMDRITYGSWRWADTLSDIAHTLFWPAVICIGVRLRPLLARSAVVSAIPGDEPSEPFGQHHPGPVAGERGEG
jgi:hypothetical protein